MSNDNTPSKASAKLPAAKDFASSAVQNKGKSPHCATYVVPYKEETRQSSQDLAMQPIDHSIGERKPNDPHSDSYYDPMLPRYS